MSANAFNVARRLSVRNEPDMVQESMVDDDNDEKLYTKEHCEKLASKIYLESNLPAECRKFQSVIQSIRRRNSNKHDHAIAFAGMSPGEAAAAMAARERGRYSHAQIQRRMTQTRRTTLTKW